MFWSANLIETYTIVYDNNSLLKNQFNKSFMFLSAWSLNMIWMFDMMKD